MTVRIRNENLDLKGQVFASTEAFVSFINSEALLEPAPSLASPLLGYGRWQILWNSIKLCTISPFFSLFSRCVHPYLKNWASHVDRKIKLSLSYPLIESLSVLQMDPHLLWRSLNTYRPGMEGYLQPLHVGLRLREFKDGQLLGSHFRLAKFYSKKGMCRGMCQWFTFRYLQTLETFPTPRECILSLAKYFEHGAADGSILFHGINLNFQAIHQIFGMRISQSFEGNFVNQSNRKIAPEPMLQSLRNLENGVYYVSILNAHMILVVKTDGADYIFEPNIGCLECPKQQFVSKIAQIIEKYAQRFHSYDESDLIVKQATSALPNDSFKVTIQSE